MAAARRQSIAGFHMTKRDRGMQRPAGLPSCATQSRCKALCVTGYGDDGTVCAATSNAAEHRPWCRDRERKNMRKVALSFGLAALMGLSACTNPYDPGQRAVGGGLLGAGAGAAIGGLAGGGRGAAIGALTGGAIGAIGGAATTPQPPPPPPPGYYNNGYPPPPPPGYGQPPPGYDQAPPPPPPGYGY
jgi:hypothetical protein